MTHASLIACPACARHVRVTDAACPFCKASLGDAVRGFSARSAPGQRLSRAALYAFGVGSLSLATACGGSVANGGAGDKDAGDDVSMVGVDAAYGGSPPDGSIGQPVYGAPFDASVPIADAGEDGPIGQPVYGAPFDASIPFPDGGEDVTIAPPYGIAPFDAGEPSDAADAADVGVAVPYGLPPEPPSH